MRDKILVGQTLLINLSDFVFMILLLFQLPSKKYQKMFKKMENKLTKKQDN